MAKCPYEFLSIYINKWQDLLTEAFIKQEYDKQYYYSEQIHTYMRVCGWTYEEYNDYTFIVIDKEWNRLYNYMFNIN